MTRYVGLFLLAGIMSPRAAQAQGYNECARDPQPKCTGNSCKRECSVRGDPVNTISQQSLHVVKDVGVQTGQGPVEVWRYYSSSPYSSLPPGPVGLATFPLPGPFGNVEYAVGFSAIQWTHDFFSFVNPNWESENEVKLFANNFSWYEFSRDKTDAGYFPPSRIARGLRERLEALDGGYRFIRQDGEQWFYRQPIVVQLAGASIPAQPIYLLSEVRRRTGEVLANVTYGVPRRADGVLAAPDGGLCGGSDAGAPFISRVAFPSGGELSFDYLWANACVLSGISYRPTSTGPKTQISAYSYTDAGALVVGGALTTAPDGGLTGEQVYARTLSTMAFSNNGVRQLTLHSYNPDKFLVSASGEGNDEDLTVQELVKNGAITFQPQAPCTMEARNSRQTTSIVGGGSPSSPSSTLASVYHYYVGPPNIDHTGIFRAREDSCGGSPSCSAGYVQRTYRSAEGQGCDQFSPAYAYGFQNKRGAWTYTKAMSDSSCGGVACGLNGDAGVYRPVEYHRGAPDPGGGAAPTASGLEVVRMNDPPTYVNGVLMDDRRSTVSAVDGGTARVSWSTFEASGYKTADYVRGWTVPALGGAAAERTRGTFYSRSRTCNDVATDGFSRTLQVKGPCWDTLTPTGTCNVSSETIVPITEFYYYDSNATGNRPGRLWKVRRYPNAPATPTAGCGGGALTTEYVDYTADGLPTQVIDEAGVSTTYTYVNRKMTQRSVAGTFTTSYGYDLDGSLRWTGFPQGNYEVLCNHQLDTGGGGCDYSSAQLARPRWRAKAGNSTGDSWAEKLEYTYNALGQLTRERYLLPGNVERRVKVYYPDAHGRTTWEGVGTATSGSASVSTARSFDGADNLEAIGSSFAGAPDFCKVGGTPSPLCAWMKFDNADRLAQLDTNPTGSVSATDSIRTCFDYDGQGNIRRVSNGCSSSSSCTLNVSSSKPSTTCSSAPIDYDVDDFGNLIRVIVPWNGAGSVPSVHRFEYDARGNVRKKQTATMAAQGVYLASTYDGLNRLLSVSRDGTGGPALLYSLIYDVPLADPGCPTPITYVGGRLSYRNDSFGRTYYSYDAEGRVLREVRQRTGYTGTCTADILNYPHTTYSYTLNGNLSSIVYPQGRTVTYGYGTGGLSDRVSGVSSSLYKAGSWTNWNFIQSVTWEPYGDLRGYQYLVGTTTPAPSSVEYFRSNSSETVRSTSTCSSWAISGGGGESGNDGTGRTRALWVSQGAQALGAGAGDVLKQFYTWQEDQLASQQTCFSSLGQVNEHRQNFGYDKTIRLNSVTGSGMPVRTTGTGANVFSRSYAYDRRGNRTGAVIDSCPHGQAMGTGLQVDFMNYTVPDSANASCLGQSSGPSYFYDGDGRVSRLATAYYWWYLDFGYSNAQAAQGGLDSVVKLVSITGATGTVGSSYGYFYDAFNRRRYKGYPISGVAEEFFYDLGHQMLSSVGPDVIADSVVRIVDDYVWLAGRPVALFRGRLDNWVRLDDSTASCNRLGETGKCGPSHIISDYLPKPVLMVDGITGATTGTAIYDEFGSINRVAMIAGTPHPYVFSNSFPIGSASLPSDGPVDVRALYNFVDVNAGVSVTLNGTAGVSLQQAAHVRSNWAPKSASNNVSISVGFSGPTNRQGVQVESLEYRRYSASATPRWTPIRFPGQFYDPESDLFENWNRYYDPTTGRYLQPEPATFDQESQMIAAGTGFLLSTYSYAGSNPNFFSDATGLHHLCKKSDIASGAALFARRGPGGYAWCPDEKEMNLPPPDQRCKDVGDLCRKECEPALDGNKKPRDKCGQGMDYGNCVNRCKARHGCPPGSY